MGDDDRFDFRVVVRVGSGEERDRSAIAGAEAGGRVGHAHPADRREDSGEHPDAQAAPQRSPVAAISEETGSDREVGAALDERAYEPPDLRSWVLAIAVDLDRDVVVALLCRHVSGLYGTADAEVERQRDDTGPRIDGSRCRPVTRSVVDDDDFGGRLRADVRDHLRDGISLLEGRHDGEAAGEGAPGAAPSLMAEASTPLRDYHQGPWADPSRPVW